RRGAVFRRGAGARLGGTAVSGHLAIVGLGPGDARYLTSEAAEALAAADALYGYAPYLDRVLARARHRRHTGDYRDARGRRAHRRAPRPRFLRAVTVRQSQAVGADRAAAR